MTDLGQRLADLDVPQKVARARQHLEPRRGEDDEWDAAVDEVLDYVMTITGATRPVLLTPDQVDQFETALEAFLANAEQYGESGDEGVRSSLRTSSDELLRSIRSWPAHLATAQEVSAAAESYRRSLGIRVAALRRDMDERDKEWAARTKAIDTEIEALRGQPDTLKESLQSSVEEIREEAQQHLKNADDQIEKLEERVSTVRAHVDEQTKRIDAALERHDDRFATSQKERDQSFSDSLEAQATAFEDQAKTFQAQIDRAIILVGALAEKSIVNAYSKEAADQAQAATRWRTLTVILGLIAATPAVWATLAAIWGDPGLVQVLSKVAATIALAGVATYAGRQSQHHRRREEEAKRLEMAFASFQPVLEEMPKEAQQEARELLVETVFGRLAHPRLMDEDGNVGHGPSVVGRLGRRAKKSEPDK